MKRQLLLAAVLLIPLLPIHRVLAQSSPAAKPGTKETAARTPLVTFVELGSVNCIPCRQMQPVMRAIEQKYGEQIKVTFYDVWKEDQKHYARTYRIRLIPTQVFLDEAGKEILRHEGFFSEKDIDAFLQSKGLRPVKKVN